MPALQTQKQASKDVNFKRREGLSLRAFSLS